jgi:hypothetical protein
VLIVAARKNADQDQKRARCTQKDVKNEDRSDYVYENKGTHDKITDDLPGFFTKMHTFRDNGQQSSGLFAENTQIAG